MYKGNCKERIFKRRFFFLVDVGASGGIDFRWLVFGNYLKAVGFDPLVKECERLNKENNHPNIKYVAAYVGCKNKKFAENKNDFFKRSSAFYANKILNLNSWDRYNSFQELVFSKIHISLSEYFKDNNMELDFLKIDTDGHEIEVLYGAEQLFEKDQFLGVYVESPFHGSTHPLSNTFANIDIFLRQRGFSLFDIEVYRYSRKDLPGKFLIEILAQTDIEQVMWANVLYLRDLGDIKYMEKYPNYQITLEKILKLTCIFEIFNLNDCAIELINIYNERLKEKYKDIEQLKELLIPPIEGKPARLKDYYEFFVKNYLEKQFERHKQCLKKYNKVAFFGAGGRLRNNITNIIRFLNDSSKIIIFDNDKNKWGYKIHNIEIVSPDKIIKFKPECIIIISTFENEIFFQLMDMQEKYNLKFDVVFFYSLYVYKGN
ncbi:FkbM family methyltransferase [Desulfothermus naphthae]